MSKYKRRNPVIVSITTQSRDESRALKLLAWVSRFSLVAMTSKERPIKVLKHVVRDGIIADTTNAYKVRVSYQPHLSKYVVENLETIDVDGDRHYACFASEVKENVLDALELFKTRLENSLENGVKRFEAPTSVLVW